MHSLVEGPRTVMEAGIILTDSATVNKARHLCKRWRGKEMYLFCK